jgi:MraZ protein
LNLDAKGRMTVPSRYRDLLQNACQGRLVITRDHNSPCLLVYPQPTWEVIESQVADLPNFDESARELQRRLIGFATDCEMDGQGRILLPPPLRELVGLDKRVMLIGQVNKFELWDEQTWSNHCKAPLLGPRDDSRVSEYLHTLSL